MACCNCRYLNIKDKKDGNINGCKYYCTKNKKYVNGAYDYCNDFDYDISRLTYESNEIYHNGEHYYDGSGLPISTQIFFIILLIILTIILNS